LAPSLTVSRVTLCEALDALGAHRDSLVVIGSHAVHERAGHVWEFSTSTKDADLAVIPVLLSAVPVIDQAMREAGFRPLSEFDEHPKHRRYLGQPGLWGRGFDQGGNPLGEVDILVPQALSGGGGDDDDQAPPATAGHGCLATRATPGIELAAADRDLMPIRSFADGSSRMAWVAGIAALLCAKAYKVADRVAQRDQSGRDRVSAKDGGDIWRLMAASDPHVVAATWLHLTADEQVGATAQDGIARMRQLVTSGVLRELAAADLDDEKLDEVEDVYFDWTHEFMAQTR